MGKISADEVDQLALRIRGTCRDRVEVETRTENGYLVVQTVITVTDVVGEHHPRAEIFLQWGRLGRGVWLWRLRVLDNAPRASAELPVGLDGWCTADLVPSAVLGFLELVMHRPPADGRR